MKILSIDTASPICSVGILEDNKLIEDIKQVNGIGENKFNKIKELITV